MSVKKGDIIKTTASDRTMVLKVNDNEALLFTGTQFIVATNIKQDRNDPDLLIWDFGKYYSDIFDLPNFKESEQNSIYIYYEGMVKDVNSLSEGMVLADDLACTQGGDIKICLGEETIAFREWFPFDGDDLDYDDLYSAEHDPIVFENQGFYSDWVIDSDWQHFLDLQNSLLFKMESDFEIEH